jgi:hypothetical protein
MATSTVNHEHRGVAVSRRSALKLTGIGLGSLAVTGVGAGGVRAGTNGAFSAGSGDPYDLWHDWSGMSGIDRVVAAGVLACNPHNAQPWRFTVEGDGISLYSDPDVTDRTAQVNGGRLLARPHLAATALGLGFHHMNQITERIDRDHATGSTDVFSTRWANLLGRPASTGLVSFRIGHPERTPGLSPRRALTDVTTKRS